MTGWGWPPLNGYVHKSCLFTPSLSGPLTLHWSTHHFCSVNNKIYVFKRKGFCNKLFWSFLKVLTGVQSQLLLHLPFSKNNYRMWKIVFLFAVSLEKKWDNIHSKNKNNLDFVKEEFSTISTVIYIRQRDVKMLQEMK